MTQELPSQDFVEQKITQQVTVNAGITTAVEISIPKDKSVFLKGYGYSWFTANIYSLVTGNVTFPDRSDQEGSPAIPVIFGRPFKCRSGGKLKLIITNNDTSNHTYDVVFYILTNELLEVKSTGGELNLVIGGAAGVASAVSIVDSTGTTPADVSADGLQTYTNSPSTLVTGTKTTATSAAIVLAASTLVKKVTLQAAVTNTDAVFVGNATNQLIRLEIGQSMDLEVHNLNTIYIKRNGANNQTINYIGA